MQKSRKVTTSNWANPRLSERQLLYAANDALLGIGDGCCLGGADPDGQIALPVAFAQQDDGLVGGHLHANAQDVDLDHPAHATPVARLGLSAPQLGPHQGRVQGQTVVQDLGGRVRARGPAAG